MGSRRIQIKNGETPDIKKNALDLRDIILKRAIFDKAITDQKQIKKITMQHNLAYLEYKIYKIKGSNKWESGHFIAHSKVSTRHKFLHPLNEYGFVELKPGGRAFKHINVSKTKEIESCSYSHPRLGDSEAKLLERLAEILEPFSVGEVTLYTEFEPCLSCDYEIFQFLENFPGIELIICYELDYN
ncbi:deaminase domain-containing protein [Neobacillus sp. PS2-9]|uniref:deaminase domain-containing protein n=1 Tax=Neobacillus sp. PS2-9 TaxID=3070676 RepID=UPI0027DF35FD|nr:deaminase domain-containing protein [Neobacillus sp. PS2-9]WML56658.1 deaminase domain-containing protein [Neobacillus sp. PS2-9]